MLCIAVTQTGGREALAVIVDNHRTEHDFITSVLIYIGNAEVVITVAKPRVVPSSIISPTPFFAQQMGDRIHFEGTHLVTCVAPASEEHEGVPAVQERCTEIVL